MPSYKIKDIDFSKFPDLSKGVYLWLIHATKIPPHVGLSMDGNYYSLKMFGRDDMGTEKVIGIVKTKKIPTIWIKLTAGEVEWKRFLTVKNRYDRINPGKTTCLSPIIEVLLHEKRSLLLPELLETLTNNKQIESFFGLNLPDHFDGLIAYENHQVEERINELRNAKGAPYFSKSR